MSSRPPPPRDARRLLPSPPGAFSFFFFSTFYFAFLVCVHILHLLPPFPVFPSALCQTHLSGPCSPASRVPSCPHLCYRPGLGSLSSACRGLGLWAVGEIPVFNRRKAPVRGEAWSRGQPASVQLLLSEAAFLAPSGLAGGSPAPSSRGGEKAIMSRDRGWGSSTGLWKLRAGWGSRCPHVDGARSPLGEPRAGAATWPCLPHPLSCSPDPVDEVGGTRGGLASPPTSPVPYQGFLPAGLTSRWSPGLAPAPSEDRGRGLPLLSA